MMKQHRIHPDTYVQMAIQLADYKLHKRYDWFGDRLISYRLRSC